MSTKTLPMIALMAAFALAALLLFGGGQDVGAQADAPTLSVTDSGLATWSYTLPDGASFTYSEVRWKLYDPSEDLNNWSGRSSQVFYSANASEYQIPNLSANTQYKAKVFVSVQQNGGAVYLKSNVVVFPQAEPTPTPTATSTPTPTATATPTPIPTETPTSTPTPQSAPGPMGDPYRSTAPTARLRRVGTPFPERRSIMSATPPTAGRAGTLP